ncbi:GatB/YqeY domain-containing protein [candidate division WWE3 bacterium]|uniref:GatB/YqeY domain-containing protein n=1 Tax=candidate division WWE3 bacterium TaxID=2053526 RepID=A0A7X9HSX6_UNCKA|nr:GatB/YqeY domain-containing protein [candidate division WWE3 bacterium]
MMVDNLRSKLIEYQKASDSFKLGVLRFFLSQVKNKEIELRAQGKELSDEDVFKVLRKEIKNRKEGIETYAKANRSDLLQKEKDELEIYLEYAKLFPFELDNPNPMAQKSN